MPQATSATPQATPQPAASVATPRPIPTPSLKPGEVITWVKVEPLRLPLGQIIVGSFALAGVVIVGAIVAGMVIGHLRSKRRRAVGVGGLGLNRPAEDDAQV